MIDAILKIQKDLRVPKNQFNKFGNYSYRSCEDIVEAAKPLCHTAGLTLHLSDEVVEVGGRVYVKATAFVSKGGAERVECTGWAREPQEQKGMAHPQITGSASSYARKYALNGLFAIDDTKDADTDEQHSQAKNAPSMTIDEACAKLSTATTPEEARSIYAKLPEHLRNDDEVKAMGKEVVDKLTK